MLSSVHAFVLHFTLGSRHTEWRKKWGQLVSFMYTVQIDLSITQQLCLGQVAPQRDEIFKEKVNDCVEHIILQKFTNFHAIRSWSFQNICSEIGWPSFFCHPVFNCHGQDHGTLVCCTAGLLTVTDFIRILCHYYQSSKVCIFVFICFFFIFYFVCLLHLTSSLLWLLNFIAICRETNKILRLENMCQTQRFVFCFFMWNFRLHL